MKHSLSKQARASVGCSWQEGACCGRDCRGFAAAHRWSSVPSGQTEVTVQSVPPFVAAPTSATSAKRHARTTMVSARGDLRCHASKSALGAAGGVIQRKGDY